MLDSTYRPVAFPKEWAGYPAPCDFFDQRGRLLLRAGFPMPLRDEHPLQPQRVYCQASQAHHISPTNPIEQLHRVGGQLAHLAESAVSGRYVDAMEFFDLAQALFDLWAMDADACVGYARLIAFDRPSIRHAILAALFSAELGAANGLHVPAVVEVMGAALTMNLASMPMHDEMFGLSGGLPPGMREEVLMHPADGVRLLQTIGGFSQGWLDAVAHHHENVDGSGYPNALVRADIGLPARMLRIADLLSARLLGRKRRAPRAWNIHQARDTRRLIQHVFGGDLERIDRTLARLLMTRLGAFPPGSLVRLSSGELAVVSRRQAGSKPVPHEVMVFVGANGKAGERLRLREVGTRDCRILSYVHDEVTRLPAHDWQQVWGYHH